MNWETREELRERAEEATLNRTTVTIQGFELLDLLDALDEADDENCDLREENQALVDQLGDASSENVILRTIRGEDA